jgi:hypothetical protein
MKQIKLLDMFRKPLYEPEVWDDLLLFPFSPNNCPYKIPVSRVEPIKFKSCKDGGVFCTTSRDTTLALPTHLTGKRFPVYTRFQLVKKN